LRPPGKVSGVDFAGVVYVGTYAEDQEGKTRIRLELTVPSGVALVIGEQLATATERRVPLELVLPAAAQIGSAVPVVTSLGPLTLRMTKTADF
jgi:hypothetical protein